MWRKLLHCYSVKKITNVAVLLSPKCNLSSGFQNSINMPKLYKRDESPPARTVMVVAHILGLSYEPHDLNPVFRDQDTPEMVKKNPMKTIPTWEEDDFCLADSHAIIMYMLEKYGKPEHEYLYPKDQKKRATIHQRLFFDCGILFPRLRAIMAPTYMGTLTELSKSQILKVHMRFWKITFKKIYI